MTRLSGLQTLHVKKSEDGGGMLRIQRNILEVEGVEG